MMTSIASESEIVVLRDGHSATVDALKLLWALEDRGLTIALEDEDLLVGPRTDLTPSDRESIREHKAELLHLGLIQFRRRFS